MGQSTSREEWTAHLYQVWHNSTVYFDPRVNRIAKIMIHFVDSDILGRYRGIDYSRPNVWVQNGFLFFGEPQGVEMPDDYLNEYQKYCFEVFNGIVTKSNNEFFNVGDDLYRDFDAPQEVIEMLNIDLGTKNGGG